VLAPQSLPPEFARWNAEHGSPFGHASGLRSRLFPRSLYERYQGPFAIQPNNTTRTFEYPWAFYATPIKPGLRVLEIGGGLSGFQFVLDREGCKVVNVDPGMDAAGVGWPCDRESIAKLNRRFGTSVELHNTVIGKAGLTAHSFDRVFSISVLEHLPEAEVEEAMRCAFDLLVPGGFLILTVDLSLDITPFTSRQANKWGRNVDMKWLCGLEPFVLAQGNPRELYGFPEFEVDAIQSNLSSYLIGGYPTLTQCVVLQKPASP
jgi:2-polyprenyl-3-methyl-5-hydroxy-6-metoxy-1,4-benzoquinol methylase